ncbi:hypothetical protein HMPREF9554_02476 [Treponema phagedenis F0421]|nr:hypothetical protein HMPREF9554_02476 [Treponema phagedenis F0421]
MITENQGEAMSLNSFGIFAQTIYHKFFAECVRKRLFFCKRKDKYPCALLWYRTR